MNRLQNEPTIYEFEQLRRFLKHKAKPEDIDNLIYFEAAEILIDQLEKAERESRTNRDYTNVVLILGILEFLMSNESMRQ